MGVYIESLESKRKSDPYFIPFENKSFLSLKEDFQKGDLAGQDKSNIPSGNEDLSKSRESLFSNDYSNNLYNLLYPNGQIIIDFSEVIAINLLINDNKENKIKYEKIKYRKKEITYEKFITSSKEEQEQQFELNEHNMLFENKEKIKEFLKKIKEIANKFFSEIRLKSELFIQIKLNEENNKNINSKYILFYKEVFLDEEQHQDKDILNNDNYKGFTLFLKDIKNSISNQANINNNSIKDATNYSMQIKKNISNQNNINNNSTKDASYSMKSKNNNGLSYSMRTNNTKNDYLLKFEKIIGKHNGIAQKVMKLDNGFISGGYDGIIQYDINFVQIGKVEPNNFITFFTHENKVIFSLLDKFAYLSEPDKSISGINGIYPCWNLFELESKNDIICNVNGIYYISDIFNHVLKINLSKLYGKDYRGGIKITDNIIAITSNRVLPNGENKLVFFSSYSKKILKEFEIEKFSFTLSENNSSIMNIPKLENSKLLLVACKKYFKDDKNGILLATLKFNEDIGKKYVKFYDTINFEVYCFCPILKIDNKNILDTAQKSETEYFLVGGFDLGKNEGLIKLYKVIYNDEIEKIKIEFIQDIIIEKKKGEKDSESFKGFKGPISCIIQSPKGEILVTCYDGNVYLLSEHIFEELKEIEDISILKLFKKNL